MKKFILSLLMVAGVAVAAGPFTRGAGKILAATTTPQQLTLASHVGELSVYNATGDVLWCLVNTSTAVLTTEVAAGTAVPIPALVTYTFNAQGQGSIRTLEYRTATGSGDVYVGGF